MYQPLLTSRYLSTRMIPLLAVIAVALCVALVTVVISVMSGFLDMVRSSGRTLMGDVVVAYELRGIPHYEDLIERIEALPEAHAASPVVHTWGLLRMPYPEGDAKASQQVQIWGIEPDSLDRVTDFADTLKWTGVPEESRDWIMLDAIREVAPGLIKGLTVTQRIDLLTLSSHGEFDDWSEAALRSLVETRPEEDLQWPLRLTSLLNRPDDLKQVIGDTGWEALVARDPRIARPGAVHADGLTLLRNGAPAIVTGLHVSRENWRLPDGSLWIGGGGQWWMPRFDATLTTMPIDSRGGLLEPTSRRLPIANEFTSGVYLIDETRVMVPIDIVQQMTMLNEAERVDEDDPTIVTGVSPARATMVLVRATEGTTPLALREAVERAYDDFASSDASLDSSLDAPPSRADANLTIKTWEEQNARFIGPVEKERELMRILFSIVYLVCGALVVAIFWAIVYEKTRDIGILRSIGASRTGIVAIFVLYGLVVGILGGLLGVGLGWLVMSNMPGIHDALSNPPAWLGIAVLALGLALAAIGMLRSAAHAAAGRPGPTAAAAVLVALSAVGAGALLARLIHATTLVHMPPVPAWMTVTLIVTVVAGLLGAFVAIPRSPCRRILPAWLGVLAAFVLGTAGYLELIFAAGGGVVLWDPAVYYFDTVPSSVDWPSAWWTAIGAIVCSVVAASIPAARAADIDPVGALRYE